MLELNKIAVIGLGVIGGSLVKALRGKGFKGKIAGVDMNEQNFLLAKAEGTIGNLENNFSSALEDADMVIVATPLGVYKEVFCAIKPFLKDGCIISDVGSVKEDVHRTFEECLGNGFIFIGGHPMAGSEKSGYEYARGHMFENAYYFLTVGENVPQSAIEAVEDLIDIMGAKAKVMDAKEHDRLVSKTSHMPHITAALLVDLLKEKDGNLLDFVGGGFKDTTRIASGLPNIWRDILVKNRTAILETMNQHIERLNDLRVLLEEASGDEIYDFLESSRSLRENIPKHLSDSIEKELAIYLDVVDKPGIIADATRTLADAEINIKDIEIIHARENIPGCLKIGFYEELDFNRAKDIFSIS